jgi:hypothetical protein
MFVLGGLCFVISIWCISRYSSRGFIASALLAMLVVSYGITYMQCNDKKVTDKLIKLMEHDQKYCNVGDKPEPGILNAFRSFFVGSPDSQCIAKMRDAYSSELEICTPAEALVVMVAQLNMKYFEEFGHQLIKTYESLTGNLMGRLFERLLHAFTFRLQVPTGGIRESSFWLSCVSFSAFWSTSSSNSV